MKIAVRIVRFIIILIISVSIWLLFVYGQQWNYGQEHQIYLIGTNLAYTLAFVFILINALFVISFYKKRNQPQKLKTQFFIFAIFYLVISPFVVLSFDNYLLITKDGIQYNPFFKVPSAKVHNWKEIHSIVLDYTVKASSLTKPRLTGQDLRLKFIIKFENGPSYDLNNYNSPLYLRDQFLTIYQYLIKRDVPVILEKPLPDNFHDPQSYFNTLFKESHEKTGDNDDKKQRTSQTEKQQPSVLTGYVKRM